MNTDVLNFLSMQQCSVQWRSFMGVFAQELTENLTTTNLRWLLRRTGQRFAKQHPLPECPTLPALEQAINRFWQSINWGSATVNEENTCLIIRHYLSPLQISMLPENMNWSTGFLEGVYETWLHQSGADSSLRLTQSGLDPELGTVEYRLERHTPDRGIG